MYSVWFADLPKAVKAFRGKFPNIVLFTSISGNVMGDFLFKTETDTYIVKHDDFSVWYQEGDWRTGKWVEAK